MGKLGGNELNYASDVDIVFAHEGDSAAAARRARKVLEILTAFTPEGQVYRVDIELRPEGGAGALSRTPEAFGTYFDRWAVPWERQAYIKTRLSAGDPDWATPSSMPSNPGFGVKTWKPTPCPTFAP